MELKEYRKKRDFSRTSEPKGFISEVRKHVKGIPKKNQPPHPPLLQTAKGRPLYMVHDHYSRRHHFDLRLEMNGLLRSWAIPKLIDPKNPYQRKLAVQTEDHPLEYGHWQGIIPKGSYGAGKSLIWDTGTYKIIDKKKSKIVFQVKGKKLKGIFVLVSFRPKEKLWLFFKKKEKN